MTPDSIEVVTYDEICVDMLYHNTMPLNFLGQSTCECSEECLGTRVCCEHRRWNRTGERTNVQYQAAFPIEKVNIQYDVRKELEHTVGSCQEE